MKRFKWMILATFLLSFMNLPAQQQQAPTVPLDPNVRYGKLGNGLTYYVRANKEPKERAEFYIVQNVGAILENDDQNGLAHFLEHMAFNGTSHFPGKGIINYFESVGVRFGYNINAYTSLDETVYNLSDVPTTREGIIDSALLVLHDWSSFISLEDKEIDNERGVIMEEWRTGANANRRLWKMLNPLKYPGSQYAKRDVIGDTAVIKHFTYEALRDYYHKWYRPDLQAIIIVGDLDADKTVDKINALFSDIPRKKNAGERPIYEIADNKEPIVAIATDPEARFTRISLEFKKDILPEEVKKSINGYVLQVANQLISTMINNRFSEITQQADAPFVAAFASYGNLVKSKDAFTMIAVPKEGQEQAGLDSLTIEAEKIKRFGFTNSELERAKTDMLKSAEKMYNERENQKNASLVREYVRNFLDGELCPGIEWEYNTLQMALPQLSVSAINNMAESYITDENLVVSISAAEKETIKLPSKESILASLANAAKAELTARAEEDLNRPLLKEIPSAGKIQKETTNTDLGVTEWTLSNGIKVILKPTDFKKDEIILTAFSKGGTSKVSDLSDLPSASFANYINGNGLGEFSQVDLEKVLTGKIASVSPYIGTYSEGFNGSSSVKDFETMLQLVYLNFTATRKDDNSYQAFIHMIQTSLSNSEKDPKKIFSDSINLVLSSHHPRTILMNSSIVPKIDQEKALRIFRDRFAVPADFTFVFTGNIDPKDPNVRKAISTYLGGLKSSQVKEDYTDNKVRTPNGNVKNYFTKDMQVKTASNFIYYHADFAYNLQNQVILKAIENLLFDRYLESIREKEGGSYGVRVSASLSDIPVKEASLLMNFDTEPEKQAKLMGIIHQEIDDMIAKGPSIESVKKIQENMLKKYEVNLRENGWWSGTIETYYEDGWNLVKDYKDAVNALTPELIQKTLKQIIDQKNVIEVVMKPAV